MIFVLVLVGAFYVAGVAASYFILGPWWTLAMLAVLLGAYLVERRRG